MEALSYGMPTLVELPDVAANVALCRRLGLAFVELNLDLPACQPEALAADDVRRWRERDGVDFTVHLPGRLDLAAFQGDVRRGHIASATAAIDWAGRAGITRLTMHLDAGVYFTLPDEKVWLYARHREAFTENLLTAMDVLVGRVERMSGRLLIENDSAWTMGYIGAAVDGLLARHGPSLGLTWDVGHDAAAGYAHTPRLTAHLDRIAHMHLHDVNDGGSHQALFTGAVDIEAHLRAARERGWTVVIETKTVESLTASVAALTARGWM